MNHQENKTKTSPSMMKKCADCGKEVSAKATGCPNCGAPLNAMLQQCPDCRKDVSIHASNCPNCGRPLEPAARTDLKPINMGFSLLALPIIIALCSWGSTKDFSVWSATSLFVLIFAVFIGIEAYRNRKIKNIGNPLFWAIGALFLYPIVYPYYMFKRKDIKLDSVVKWVSVPLALLSVYFWIVSFDLPHINFAVNDDFSSAFFDENTDVSASASAPAGDKSPYEKMICKKAQTAMTEWLATMEGSRAPACTSVTIVKKTTKTTWIGQATTSDGRSGEISIDITAFGDYDPDPFVMVMPVEMTDFYNFGMNDDSSTASVDESADTSTSVSAPAGDKSSYEKMICQKAQTDMTEWLATMEGSRAPACTSVTIVKKTTKTKWIGQATTSDGKSGEISIDIMSFGDDDPDPVLMVMPVDMTDFYNPFENFM